MRGLFLRAFVTLGVTSFVAIGAIGLAACDPYLTPARAGDAGIDGPRTSPPGTSSSSGGVDPNADGGSAEAGVDTDAGVDSGVSHAIDGKNDFLPGEKLVTSSTSTGYEG